MTNTDPNFLTVHTLTSLPFHNRNRDDRGQPKQLIEGGANRSYLSSQSRKRAMRVGFERDAAEVREFSGSVRSKLVPEAAVARAAELAAAAGVPFDQQEALTRARLTVKSLTNGVSKTDKDAAKKRSAHLAKAKPGTDVDAYMAEYDSVTAAAAEKRAEAAAAKTDTDQEPESKDVVVNVSEQGIENLAVALVHSQGDIESEDVFDASNTSLVMAGFGTMYAAKPNLSTEAAVAVSPAVTTHPISINIDYFTAVDDLRTKGAAHLDQAFYTSGVYYGSVTFDRRQLRKNWSDMDAPFADEELAAFVRHTILGLPQGKKNSTAADTFPSVIIAEQQRTRTGYQFHTPVEADERGGYLEPSSVELYRQANAARAFDPDNFGASYVSGLTVLGKASEVEDAKVVNLGALIIAIVEWLKA